MLYRARTVTDAEIEQVQVERETIAVWAYFRDERGPLFEDWALDREYHSGFEHGYKGVSRSFSPYNYRSLTFPRL